VEPRRHAFVSAQEAVASAASQPSGGSENEAIIDANHGRHLYLCVVRSSCDARERLLVGQRQDVARRPLITSQRRETVCFASLIDVALKWQFRKYVGRTLKTFQLGYPEFGRGLFPIIDRFPRINHRSCKIHQRQNDGHAERGSSRPSPLTEPARHLPLRIEIS
jgi:hypothetical protein